MKMKKYSNWIFSMTAAILLTSMVATSCVDEIAFGDSFLEKAPGGSSKYPLASFVDPRIGNM